MEIVEGTSLQGSVLSTLLVFLILEEGLNRPLFLAPQLSAGISWAWTDILFPGSQPQGGPAGGSVYSWPGNQMLSSSSQRQPRVWSFPSLGFGQWKDSLLPTQEAGNRLSIYEQALWRGSDSSAGSSQLSMGILSFVCFQLWTLVGISVYRNHSSRHLLQCSRKQPLGYIQTRYSNNRISEARRSCLQNSP